MPHREIASEFLSKARSGDGQFAVAYSILMLAQEHRKLQENLTFGDGSATREHGTFEKIAIVMGDINETLGSIAERLPDRD